MKRFLHILFWFSLPFAVAASVLIASFILEWNAFSSRLILPEKTAISVGDSHIQYALDDRCTPLLKNLAIRTTTPPFWRAMVRLALERNPQLKTVYIGVHPKLMLNRATDRENLWFSRGCIPGLLMLDVMCHSDIGLFDERRFVRRCYEGVVEPAWRHVLDGGCQNPVCMGFLPIHTTVVDFKKWPKEHKRGITPEGHTDNYAELDDLLVLIRSYGAEPVLLTVPIPERYLSAFTPEQMAYAKSEIASLQKKHGVRWLDYSHWTNDPALFGDEFHMNAPGGAKFSAFFNSILERTNK